MPQLDSAPEFLEPYYDNMIDLLPRATSEFPFLAGAVLKPAERHDAQHLVLTGNLANRLQDSTAHAELVVVRYVLHELGGKHLPRGTWLYSNCEPCMMCAGAIANAFERDDEESGLVFGVYQDDLRGQSAQVNGEIKPFRTNPEGFDSVAFLMESLPQLQIVRGFKRENIAAKMGILLTKQVV